MESQKKKKNCRESAQSEFPGILLQLIYFIPKRKTAIEEYPFMCKAKNLGQNKSKGYPCTLPQACSEKIPILFLTSES